MTITNQNLRNDYVGNGSSTTYAFTFPILYEVSSSPKYSIQVIVTDLSGIESVKTENIDYTVSYDSATRLGNIIFAVAPALNYKISFLRNLSFTQNAKYTDSGTDKFSGATHEGALDKSVLLCLQILENINRVVKVPRSSTLTNLEFPISAASADQVVAINSTGDGLSTKNLIDVSLAPVSGYMKTLLDDADAATARTTLQAQQLNSNLTSLSNNTLLATTSVRGLSYLTSPITIANNSVTPNTQVDFSGGIFIFSDGSGQETATALTKKLDATWVAGNGNGGLDTGTKAVSTWYHCYAIYNPTTLAKDFLFSTNATTPTSLPSGYTKFKRVGAVRTDASGNIYAFKQKGNKFTLNTPVTIASGATAASRQTIPAIAPINSTAIFRGSLTSSATAGSSTFIIFSSLDLSDITPVSSNCHLAANVGYMTAGQFQTECQLTTSNIGYRASDTLGTISLVSEAWIDNIN